MTPPQEHAPGTMIGFDLTVPDAESIAWGVNADLPPQWLTYIVVADLEASLQRCDGRWPARHQCPSEC
jgi:hypothetical protein